MLLAQKDTSNSSMVVFSSCTFRSCWDSTSPDSVPPAISFRYCWSILSMAAFRSFLKPCGQKNPPEHSPQRKLKQLTQKNKHTQRHSTNLSLYLVYFWSENLNFPESLKGIVVGLSKESDWFPAFSEATDNLLKKTHTGLYKITNKQKREILTVSIVTHFLP